MSKTEDFVQTLIKYSISEDILKTLLKDGHLTENEYEVALSLVREKYDLDATEMEAYKHSSAPHLAIPSNANTRVITKPKQTASKERPKSELEYFSLTEAARNLEFANTGYAIQSWLRQSNTVEFLNLWESENNPDYDKDGYDAIKEKIESGSFTLTPKQWISQTKAIGLISRQGKNGGTFAHPIVACDFLMWLDPEFKLRIIEMNRAIRYDKR